MDNINILFLINIIYFSIILIIEIFFSDMNLYVTGCTLLFLLIIIVFMIYLNILKRRNVENLSDYDSLIEKGGDNDIIHHQSLLKKHKKNRSSSSSSLSSNC